MKLKTPMERWQSRVVLSTDGCWRWTGAKNHKGYGHLNVAGSMVKAHRFAYEVFVGPIPDGLHIDHLCRVRECVNPAHLEPVTCRENLLRGETANARRAALTVCERGLHPFDAINTYIRPSGRRSSRACNRARNKISAAARKLVKP